MINCGNEILRGKQKKKKTWTKLLKSVHKNELSTKIATVYFKNLNVY